MNNADSPFLKNLELFRKRANLPQSRLSTIVGFKQNMISSWGRKTADPLIENLIKVSTVLGFQVKYLLRETPLSEFTIDETMQENIHTLYYDLDESEKEKLYVELVRKYPDLLNSEN